MNNESKESKNNNNHIETNTPHVHGPNCNHQHHDVKQVIRQSQKTGRNDPCLCGSGKKYKKCCSK